jgi:membrane protease subunit HflK
VRELLERVGLGRAAVVVLAVAYLATGVYTVQRDEEGVVLLLGKPWKTQAPPGIHFAPPWPFGKREVVRTTSAYQMSIGFKFTESVAGKPPEPAEVEFLTGDTNIVAAELILQYVIDGPFPFLYGVEDPHFLVRRAGEATVTSLLARTPVDEALTTGRAAFLEEVELGTQQKLRSYETGVAIVSATLKRIEPPAEVIDAFQDVQNAKADLGRSINEATGYANEILPRARGESDALISAAQAERSSRIEIARGDAERIEKITEEYRQAPLMTKSRMYLEVVERVLESANLYVIDGGKGRRPIGLKLIE